MAGIKKARARTVRFFEVVDLGTGLPYEHDLPWEEVLTDLSHHTIKPEDRTVEFGGVDHHGGPWLLSGFPSMLLFSAIREDLVLPDIFDRASGELEALELAEQKGLAETSHIGFFPSNIVGVIRTNTTPGVGSLEKWINKMQLFTHIGDLSIQSLSRVSVQQRIRDVERARSITLRMRTSAAQAIAGPAPRIADIFERVEERFGPVKVEMKISLAENHGSEDVSDNLMAEAEGLFTITDTGTAISGLEAVRMSYMSREKEKVDEVDMLADKLAETVYVQAVDDEGRSVRRESAAMAMQRAYDHLKDELHTAIGRSR